jgi:hypothetical protein
LWLAADERRQHTLFLLFGSELDHGVEAEDVHVHRGRAGHAGAGLGDRLHHDRGFSDAEAGTAVSLRHRDTEQAGVGDASVKGVRECRLLVMLEPVGIVEVRAEPFRQLADLNLLGRVGEIHAQGPSGAVAISAWAHRKNTADARRSRSCRLRRGSVHSPPEQEPADQERVGHNCSLGHAHARVGLV